MSDLRVTLVQSEIFWEDIEKNLSHLTQELSLVLKPTDLIILPEMFTTGFSMTPAKLAEGFDGRAIQWLTWMAREKACVITGSVIFKEGKNYSNRLIWMRPEGSFSWYDKRHLFRLGQENLTYKAGLKRLIETVKGWKVCPLICYDLRFPAWSRNRFDPEKQVYDYDCLIYIASWPAVRSYPWRMLLIARAIENQAFVIGVNRIGTDGRGQRYCGDSMVLDPLGQVIRQTLPETPAIETVTLNLKTLQDQREQFPVALDADRFEIP